MASKNTNTKSPRFRVERDRDGRFLILDTIECAYTSCPSGTTRVQAEQECATRNGTRKSSDCALINFDRKLRQTGVIMNDIDAAEEAQAYAEERMRLPDYVRPLFDQRQQRLAAQFARWVPGMLAVWADEVAARFGYGGNKRRSWLLADVVAAVETDGSHFTFTAQPIEEIHAEVWPNIDGWAGAGIEQRTALAVHYLSPAPAHIKAAHFQISKRTYLRRVAASLRWLAGRWVGIPGEYLQWPQDEGDDDVNADDNWNIDAEDLADGYGVEDFPISSWHT